MTRYYDDRGAEAPKRDVNGHVIGWWNTELKCINFCKECGQEAENYRDGICSACVKKFMLGLMKFMGY